MLFTTSEKGLNVIRSFEGRALRAYQDSVGVWTIGYGNTNSDANAVAKWGKIGKGLQITAEQAEAVFVESIRTGYEPAVYRRLEPLGEKLTQPMFDAGSGFHYNTGAIDKATWPTALIRGDMKLAETSIKSWDHAGPSRPPGLTRRRNREWLMISLGDYGPEGSQGPMDLDSKKPLPAPGPMDVSPPPAPRVPGMLQLGDSGPAVKELNGYLTLLGRLKNYQNDKFTAETEAAVRAFQQSHPNLTVDGKVGPATTASLQRDLKMREAAVKTGKVTGTIATAGTAAVAFGWLTAKVVLVAVAAAGSAGLIFIVLNHRTELETLWNTLRGKQVP